MMPLLPARAQDVPRLLFPPLTPPIEVAPPAAPMPPSALDRPAIAVEPLPPPSEAMAGLASAEDMLAGPLWARGAPPDLALLLQRLPDSIAEPTLRELQKALLAAPGPDDETTDLLRLRLDKLLSMDEPAAALELLGAATARAADRELEARRLLAYLVADQSEPACILARADAMPDWPWVGARLLCDALDRDVAAVELGLDVLASRGQPAAPAFVALLRAQATGGRARLDPPLPDDPLLLPLLRRVPLELSPTEVAKLAPAAKRALLANQGVPTALRTAASATRAGPSARPELNGAPPADWSLAFEQVPTAHRDTWTALVDGLGLEVPDVVWASLLRRPAASFGSAPSLALWRGFEVARARDQRGAILLHVLLLLEGRPEVAAPITLRRSLDALTALDLEPAARALAAGTGGALGL